MADCQTCSKTEETVTCSACTALRPLLTRGHQSRGNRAEGTAQFAHRHRGVLRVSSAPGGLRPARHPAGTAPATAQVRTQRPNDTHQPNSPTSDPHPCQRAESDPQRDSPPHGSQRRQLHHLRPSSDLTLSYEARGRAQYSLRDPLARTATAERATLSLRAPAGWGPAAQHWTAYVWMRQHLRGIRSAPKAVLAHAAPARGIVHVSRRVLPSGWSESWKYSLHCCIRGQMHKGRRGALRPARRNCSQTVRCEVRRYNWSVS